MADSQKLVLPLEYQEVEYIENASTTQYIDTGWKRDFNKDIEIEAVIKPSTINKRYCIISDYSPQYLYNMSFEITGDNFGRVFINAVNNLVGTRPYNSNEFNIFKFSYDHTTPSGTVEVDSGSDSKTYQTEVRRIAVDNARIFVDNDSGFNVFNHSFKLKKMRIKEDNVLVRNFIPCYRKSNNEAGLYDTVNDVFYTNQGTGSFTVGSNISPWLHSLRKLTTATEAIENPLYSDGTAITAYTIKGNTVQNSTPTPSNPVDVNGVGVRTENLLDYSTFADDYWLDISSGLPVPYGGSGGSRTATLTPIDVSALSKVTFNYSYIASSTLFIYSLFNGNTLVTRVAGNSENSVIDVTGGDKLYLCFYSSKGQSVTTSNVSNAMLNTGSIAKPYEPYGYKIPISSGGVTTNIYLGSTQTVRKIKKLVLTGEEDFEVRTSSITGKTVFRLSVNNYLRQSENVPIASHYQGLEPISDIGNIVTNNSAAFLVSSSGSNYMYIRDDSANTLSDFKSYLAAQYAAGTPVTIWYVLATPETAVVNEPLMKIGTYADTLSNAVQIPTTEGANSITVDTTVQPSEFTATWTGWHNASVKEWDGSGWQ